MAKRSELCVCYPGNSCHLCSDRDCWAPTHEAEIVDMAACDAIRLARMLGCDLDPITVDKQNTTLGQYLGTLKMLDNVDYLQIIYFHDASWTLGSVTEMLRHRFRTEGIGLVPDNAEIPAEVVVVRIPAITVTLPPGLQHRPRHEIQEWLRVGMECMLFPDGAPISWYSNYDVQSLIDEVNNEPDTISISDRRNDGGFAPAAPGMGEPASTT